MQTVLLLPSLLIALYITSADPNKRARVDPAGAEPVESPGSTTRPVGNVVEQSEADQLRRSSRIPPVQPPTVQINKSTFEKAFDSFVGSFS
jgi:hypothetical protein